MTRAGLTAGALLLLTACSTVESHLAYAPSAPLPSLSGPPSVAVVAVSDVRNADPTALGRARGTLGAPVERLTTRPAVAPTVQAAFTSALASRGLLAPLGRQRYDVTVQVSDLQGGAQFGAHGSARYVVSVSRHDTGQQTFTETVDASESSALMPSLDSLAWVADGDSVKHAQGAMSRAIDRALDAPAFRAAIAG